MSFYKNVGDIKKFAPGEYLKVGERCVVDTDEIVEKSGLICKYPLNIKNMVIEVTPAIDTPFTHCMGCAFKITVNEQERCWLSQFQYPYPGCYDRCVMYKDNTDSIIYKKAEI